MRTHRTHSIWPLTRVLGGSTALLLVITLAPNAMAEVCYEVEPGQVWEDTFPAWVNLYTGVRFTGTCRSVPMNTTKESCCAPDRSPC